MRNKSETISMAWSINSFPWLVFIAVLVFGSGSLAKTQVSDVTGSTEQSSDDSSVTPVTRPFSAGEGEARKYFKKKTDQESPDDEKTTGAPEHFLAVHAGGFFSSDSYSWGSTNHTPNPGRLQGGVTYKLSPFGHAADWVVRGDFIGYQFNDGTALNFSVLPMLIFPDVATTFPLYFGLGFGPGVFFQQIDNLSTLSFNYELVAGARFFNIIGSTGFFVETGLKNEIHILSQGQFNGFFLSVGALFVF
jgi:hypothetical protein